MPDYSKSGKKETARQDTIIDMYRSLFNKESLPKDKEYWTLSAACSENGRLRSGCELDQVLKNKLITIAQFHGVDYNEEIYSSNKQALPEANWHHGDFSNVLVENSKFNPGIVNYDSMVMHGDAVPYVAKILKLLTRRDIYNVLLVCNIAISIRSGNKISTWKDIEYSLNSNRSLISYFKEGNWKLLGDVYEYQGSNKKQTVMGTFFVYRK